MGKAGRWAEGYVRVKISGHAIERFLNLCKNSRLGYWTVNQEKDGCCFCMSVNDFRKVRPLVKKSHVRLKIQRRIGLPFFLYRNRKRKAMAVSILSFFVILYVLSLFIWNISFEGNHQYSDDTLLDYLQEEQIRCGIWKSQIDCDSLEEGIRSRFPEITWVSASVSGTHLLVKIKENEVYMKVPERSNEPCEIVAGSAGTIVRMIVRQGKAVVLPGETVEQGQQLVSGYLSLIDDSGEVIRTASVCADGDIIAETKYEYSETYPQYHTVTAETGKKLYGAGLGAGPYKWRLLLPESGENLWKYAVSTKQLHLFQNFYLPIFTEQIEAREYVVYERPYTQQEKIETAQIVEKNYLGKLMEKGVQIIENNVKIQENDSGWIIQVSVTAQEQIGVKRRINEIEETIEADERN